MVPSYNEETNLQALHEALDGLSKGTYQVSPSSSAEGGEASPITMDMTCYEWEFLFINDGSRDSTLSILRDMRRKDPRVNVVNLTRNFGKENAMLAGFDFAKGDGVVIMDADLQHPIATVPEMIYWWEQGYEDVYGKRRSRGKESWLRKHLSLTFYNMLQKYTKVPVLQNVGDFRLLDRRAVNAIRKLRETQRYTKGLYCWVGYNKKEVLYDTLDRAGGVSSFRFMGLFNLAVEGITSYTTSPLRLSAIAGVIISSISLLYVLYILIKTAIYGDTAQGFPTLACCILFLGGIQLISVGIIGEYIGRIFNETKGRPAYLVESYNETLL